MRVPIIMPQLGESIAEATVVNIVVKPGDQVAADQEIIEVETNKALLHVTTPCAGEIAELLVEAAGHLRCRRDARVHRGRARGNRERLGPHAPARRRFADEPSAPMIDVEPGQPAPFRQRHRQRQRLRRPGPARTALRTALRRHLARDRPGDEPAHRHNGGRRRFARARAAGRGGFPVAAAQGAAGRNWASARPISPPCPAPARADA